MAREKEQVRKKRSSEKKKGDDTIDEKRKRKKRAPIELFPRRSQRNTPRPPLPMPPTDRARTLLSSASDIDRKNEHGAGQLEKEKKMRFPSYLARDGAAAAAEKERRPAPLERRAQHPRAQVPHTERERGTETRDNCPWAPGFLFQNVRAVKERKNNDLCFFSSRAKSFPPFFPWLRFAPLFLFFASLARSLCVLALLFRWWGARDSLLSDAKALKEGTEAHTGRAHALAVLSLGWFLSSSSFDARSLGPRRCGAASAEPLVGSLFFVARERACSRSSSSLESE